MNKKKTVLIILFVIITLFSSNVFSHGKLDINRFNSYKGLLDGKYKIRMLLYPDEKGDIVGNYFYEKYQIKIPIKGYFQKDNIVLFEFDKENRQSAKFIGQIVDDYCTFKGEWVSFKNGQHLNFDVKLLSTFPGKPDNIYTDAGAKSTKEVEKFMAELKKEILSKDMVKVAEKIAYPINIKIDGKIAEIKNKSDIISNFEKIFYNEFVNSIKNCLPLNMDSSYKGIMFGDKGQIWLFYFTDEDRLKVIAINNDVWQLEK